MTYPYKSPLSRLDARASVNLTLSWGIQKSSALPIASAIISSRVWQLPREQQRDELVTEVLWQTAPRLLRQTNGAAFPGLRTLCQQLRCELSGHRVPAVQECLKTGVRFVAIMNLGRMHKALARFLVVDQRR